MFSSPFERILRIGAGILLIAGTCIGGGMLALPTRAASVGFIPSLGMMGLCACFMTLTGLLFFEATLWMEEGAHIITLSSRLLGWWGKLVAWVVYLFIGYASLIGYIWASGDTVSMAINHVFGLALTPFWGSVCFTTLFLFVFYIGKQFTSAINTLLFTAMILAFISLISLGTSGITGAGLWRESWQVGGLIPIIPILLTSFSIPGLVPTLAPYLKREASAMHWVLMGGMGLTFVVYAVWLLVVLGSTPAEGPESLAVAFERGELATCTLSCALSDPLLSRLARAFEFFALATSFLGIGLALLDFLADGLKMVQTWVNKVALLLLIGIPSFVFSQTIERAFDLMIDLSGGIGDAILSGLLPTFMVWSGRYRKGYTGDYRVWGGRGMLAVLSLFAGGILAYEVLLWFI